MKNALKHYQGLYGDYTINNPHSDFFHYEALAVRSKMYNWEILEHFHSDLLQLFFIKSGGGKFLINHQPITIEAPCVITIPANTLHGFYFNDTIEGDVLTVSQRFLEQLFKQNTAIFTESLQRTQLSYQSESDDYTYLSGLFETINLEIIENNREKIFALKSLFSMLFLHLYRNVFNEEKRELLANNRTLAHFQEFLSVIKQSIDQEKKISDYAKSLNMTTVHLNRICRQVVGKSALQVVQDIVIQEAKNYLLNTSYSVAEIAYFLNFNDPAYFNRLFKKWVGVSPGEFRKG